MFKYTITRGDIMTFDEFDPFYEIERLHRRLNELTRRLSESFREPWRVWSEELRYETFPVDLSDTDGELVLKADLPGFEKDDLRVRVTEDSVEIVAERKREKKEITKTMYRRERVMGNLKRFLALPVKIDPESVDAEFKNGVLTLRMKKKEVKKGKEIKIK